MRKTCLFAPLLAFAATQASAGDPARGETLAIAWCSACHLVSDAHPGGDIGPSFASVAPPENRSEDALRTWISNPHPPMPDYNLSAVEIEDIVAYIGTLGR